MKKLHLFILTVILLSTAGFTQEEGKINLPDIPGFYTMKCDFHMHTVFSDGVVWPRVRVQEALQEGLDAIAITDHLESAPRHIEDDKTLGYEMAKRAVRDQDLVIVPGGEISASRDHFNALFLTDQNEQGLKDKDPETRINAAVEQGAFVFWNHPGWTPRAKDGVAPFDKDFIKMMKEGKIQGIEVCNGGSYFDNALEMCLKYDLAIMGTSDIHGISYYHLQEDNHRTVTLVFTREKTVEGIQEALLDRRTAVYQGDHIIGREEFLEPLFMSALEVSAAYRGGTQLAEVAIVNNSDVDFICENTGKYNFYNSPHIFTIKANSTTEITVKTIEELESFDLDLLILNAITAPRESMEVKLPVSIASSE